MAAASAGLQDLVSLGALLAELGEFEEAERSYAKALQQYRDVSPFAFAWLCFQLGLLWGEIVPGTQLGRAANWYERAIQYLPGYTRARVHLAEIYLSRGDLEGAEALLAPVVGSGDPEVIWRLAQVMEGQARLGEAEVQRNAARSAFRKSPREARTRVCGSRCRILPEQWRRSQASLRPGATQSGQSTNSSRLRTRLRGCNPVGRGRFCVGAAPSGPHEVRFNEWIRALTPGKANFLSGPARQWQRLIHDQTQINYHLPWRLCRRAGCG